MKRLLSAFTIVYLLFFASCLIRQFSPAEQHIDRGNSLFDKGDVDGAIAEFDKAIALNPNHAYYLPP